MPNRQIVIITGCSIKKQAKKAPAHKLYQGVVFKKVKDLAKLHDLDFMILSAKYGLIQSTEIIEPYDLVIKNKTDVLKLQEIVIPKLFQIENDYTLIILIMGRNYRAVIAPRFGEKYKMIHDYRGIGGLTSRLNKYLNSTLQDLLDDLENCRI
ncbi:MAG: hypothetical protein KGD73_10110 [Candidatus Lokiarchaeota archaeon]|nr:hypothetical protein [Candidatus Lokiarchaeota archaeon]